MAKRVYIYIVLLLYPVMNLTAQHKLYIYHVDPAVVLCDSFRVSDSVAATEKLKKLQQADLNKGYFFAGYDSVVYGKNLIEGWYRRGVKYSWDTVIIESSSQFADSDFKFEKLVSLPPSPLRIKEWTQKIQTDLYDQGFPDAFVLVDSMDISDDREIMICIAVNQGGKVYFDGFIYPYFDDFPEALLPARTGLNKGDVFFADRLNAINRVLSDIEFVELSENWHTERLDSLFRIIVPLKELKANRFSGMLGILPGDDVQNLYLTGQLDLRLMNVFSKAESIAFHWKAPDKASQNLKFSVGFPLVYKQFGAAADFVIEKKDSSFLDVGFIGKVNYMNGRNVTGIFYEQENKQTISGSDNENTGSIQSSLVGMSYVYSGLDYIQNPYRGVYAGLSIGGGSRYDENTGNSNFKSKSVFDLQYYCPVFSDWSLRFSHASGIILSESLYYNENFRLGGYGLFRAYQNHAFWAPWYGSLAVDMLFYPDKYSSLFLFAESGVVDSKKGLVQGRFFPFSIGGGLNISTSFGILKLSYGIGRTKHTFIDFRQSQVYIGYANNF
ncbi:MAG: hypothetical protein ACOCVX_02415 [Bacteroidales bacterium]